MYTVLTHLACIYRQLMKDEYEALQITCNSIEGKVKQLHKENDHLVSILIMYVCNFSTYIIPVCIIKGH